MANPRVCRHKSKFRTAPLALSNPFIKKERRAAFDESVRALTKLFPDASVAWVRRSAWAKGRSIVVPRKRRAS